jgi:hypothetical protein
MAENSAGWVLEGILRADLILIDEIGFAPMDNTGAQLSFASSLPPMNDGHSGSRRIGRSRTGDGSCPTVQQPSACSTDCFITACSSSPKASRSA